MFSKEKNRNSGRTGVTGAVMSSIAKGLSLNGDILSDHDMRIDGHVTGNIRSSAKVVIGESAIIDGDLEAANADIFGAINGNVTTTELLCLKSNCVINGNISVGRLDIETNAVFNGKCTMSPVHKPSDLLTEGVVTFQ